MLNLSLRITVYCLLYYIRNPKWQQSNADIFSVWGHNHWISKSLYCRHYDKLTVDFNNHCQNQVTLIHLQLQRQRKKCQIRLWIENCLSFPNIHFQQGTGQFSKYYTTWEILFSTCTVSWVSHAVSECHGHERKVFDTGHITISTQTAYWQVMIWGHHRCCPETWTATISIRGDWWTIHGTHEPALHLQHTSKIKDRTKSNCHLRCMQSYTWIWN